ncbi:polysaccharide pyruvyl transferase family protein [Virgibacillus dakarensis]|nr:polysaccharide pyruvyl transferase family protein [Virgibacillus dakarensis]
MNLSIRQLIANKCSAIVHIGGSIFMQKESWNQLRINKSMVRDKPYFVLGANFGPFTDELFYKQHYELFKGYTDICFRDNYSYELFKNLDNVRKADDIVFQLDSRHPVKIEKYIVISVIKPSFRKNLSDCDDIYFQKIKDITVYFINNGYEVTLMSFCGNEGDQEAIDKIAKIIPSEKRDSVRKYYYKSNVTEALKVISSSSYVIATRFHAMILGWLYNKPVFPISYSEKMNNVMADIGYRGSYIDLKRIQSLKVVNVYYGLKTNFVNITFQINNSEKHFKILDKFLLS